MSETLDYRPALEAASEAEASIAAAFALVDEGRQRAREAMQAGAPVFAAIGGEAWYDSAIVLAEAAASGAALGATFGPVGAVLGGFVGAVAGALSQPGVGVATYRGECTLPDGTKVETVNELNDCLCYKRTPAVKLKAEQAQTEFLTWWNGTKRRICGGSSGCENIYVSGYPYDHKVGIAPKLDTEAQALAWWSQNRRSDIATRTAIVRDCLPRYAGSAQGRAAAEGLFDGRFGDRWYWGDETLFGYSVRQIPVFVPVSESLVTRWLLLAASIGLRPADVDRVSSIGDPRIGVASSSETIESLDAEKRRAVIANSIVIVLARSGGVVTVAEEGLRLVDASAGRLGVSVSDADVAAAWRRLSTPGVGFAAAPSRFSWWWIVGGAALLVVLSRATTRRARRG